MSKFCIDIEGMALPDAIAAVIEAWYDAQNVESLIKESNNALMPGDPIQIKDCASGTWEEGWVFYKRGATKAGVCLASEWNHEQKKPNFIINNPWFGNVYAHYSESGCRLKEYCNIRRAAESVDQARLAKRHGI